MKAMRAQRGRVEPTRSDEQRAIAAERNRQWQCRDGRAMRVHQMDDSHLLNALAFLLRQGFVDGDPLDEDYQRDRHESQVWGYPGPPTRSRFVGIFKREIGRREILA